MKDYVLSIIVAGVVCAITQSLLNKRTAVGKILRILTGILMVITVISPIADIRFLNITDYIDGLSLEVDAYVADGKTMAQESIGGIIKSQVEAYILDKATNMNLELAVEVELDDSNNSVPCGVTINGDASPYAKQVLQTYIAETLGIAKEKQMWK